MHSARILVVEDNAALLGSLVRFLNECGHSAKGCDSAEQACEQITESRHDLVILDYQLRDTTALEVLDRVDNISPMPATVIISGAALPEQAFNFAQRGVRHFLSKPVDSERLLQCVDQILTHGPDLQPHLRASVGHIAVRDLEQQVRTTMVKEALARSGGNRRAAARLLQVSRELLQHMLRRQT